MKTLTLLLVLLLDLLFFGCSSSTKTVFRHQESYVRRMPQLNNVETGRPLKKGAFAAAIKGAYALRQPDMMSLTDSTTNTKTDIFGNVFTTITSSEVHCLESRIMFNGEGMYAVLDEFSLGVGINGSFGYIHDAPRAAGETIQDDNIEGALFIRFAKQYNRIAVCIRPEVMLAHFYGTKHWRQYNDDSTFFTTSQRVNEFTFAIRSNFVVRYDIAPRMSPLIGVGFRSQPYPGPDDLKSHDIAYGIYCGVDTRFGPVSACPFLAIPLGSITGHFRSPISAGIAVSFTLPIEKSNLKR